MSADMQTCRWEPLAITAAIVFILCVAFWRY